jgi:rubrerythrin
LIENGSWAPLAAKRMKDMLENSKNLTFTKTNVKILSALNEESIKQIERLCDELCQNETEEIKAEETAAKKSYRCKICGYIYEGDEPPEDFICPWCRRGADEFEEVE